MSFGRQVRHWFPVLASAVLLLTACSSGGATPTAGTPSTSARPDRAGLVDVGGGREMYLECQGTGSPTVVLVSGLGDSAETFDLATVFAELRRAPPAPDVPVIVLTADTPQLTPEVVASGQLPTEVDQAFADALWAAQMAAQAELPAKFSHAVHVTDTRSDHYIHLGNPQLVIDSIREVVDEAG